MDEEVLIQKQLASQTRDEMFELFTSYYDEVARTTFDEDLANKDLVILLRDSSRKIVAFTTLAVSETRDTARHVRYIYSGDTITNSDYWGPGHLLRSWFRLAGSIRAEHPKTNLYWILLVKGHRTYRILNGFFKHYVPRLGQQQDPKLTELRDDFCRRKFGIYFDASTGLIRFPTTRGQLASHLQDEEAFKGKPLVGEFLKLNPQGGQGVELACIAELCESNLKSYARAEFARGMCEHPRKNA